MVHWYGGGSTVASCSIDLTCFTFDTFSFCVRRRKGCWIMMVKNRHAKPEANEIGLVLLIPSFAFVCLHRSRSTCRSMSTHDHLSLDAAISATHLNTKILLYRNSVAYSGHHFFGECRLAFIFTLADSTFAFACNSHNNNAVAASASIEFLKPAQLGDVLTSTGVEQVLAGRHGVYDMTVRNQRDEVIAVFRGKSAQIAGTVVNT